MRRWDTFKDSSESEDDAAGSGGAEAAPPNAVEVLSEADLERMAAACRIEDESRAVVETLATTVFAFPGATRPLTRLSPHAVGGYFDSSKGYVELDDLEDGVLGDLRAGFHDNDVDGGIKAHEWRGKEAVAFLFYVDRPEQESLSPLRELVAAGVQVHDDQAPPHPKSPQVGAPRRDVRGRPVDLGPLTSRQWGD